jgi:hypothetical protein
MPKAEAQFVVVRYMFSDLREEAANVGIIVVSETPPRLIPRFLDDPAFKSRGDVKVQRDVVDRFRAWLDKNVATLLDHVSPDQVFERVFHALREHTGNIIRLLGPRVVLTDDIEAEAGLLFQEWVAPLSGSRRLMPPGPRDPLGGLRREASKAIARAIRETLKSPLPRRIFVRNYEVAGARHVNHFDVAVLQPGRPKVREFLFHHVLMLPEPEESFDQAAALCWRWGDIRSAGNGHRRLTAVLYGRGGEPMRGLGNSTTILKDSKIEVARLSELPRLAEELRDEYPLIV